MIVDRVSKALQGDPPDASIDDEGGSLEDDEDVMSDEVEHDNFMTLRQFQAEVRRDAFIRKGSQFIGPKFTWCNKQGGSARRWALLNRGLINLEWSSHCRSTSLQHLPKVMLVVIVLAGLSNLDMDIRSTEAIISSLELSDTFDKGTQAYLEEMYAKYAALERQNTNKWAQRAHMDWVCDGDTNSEFFHNINRIRKHINHITQVKDVNGNLFSDHFGIENAFLNFYSNMWSNSSTDSFSDILSVIPHDLPQLSAMDSDFLIREVTREEICLSVFELPSESKRALFRVAVPLINIIALQEVAHTIETDCKNLPRMLVKIDIEKAYDTISWSAILSTLTKMSFSFVWISSIKSCFTSTSFSFLINGHPSYWISSSRGIRQGDLISSYLFILVSQNLTSILNFALANDFVPGFDMRLHVNFNHLMFADDLVIISQASHKSARFIKLCFDFYGKISGQVPNASKSAIYFPSWANKRVANRICSILNFSAGSFPFKYLGILISAKWLVRSTFDVITDNIKGRCSRWMHSKLSPTAKAVLINSSLLSLPIYYLSMYPIYDSILMEIHRVVRRFFWRKSSNGKGIHAVAWNDLTIPKTEGGLAIRKLTLDKHSLMAKNVFKYLNCDNYLWVDILLLKYGLVNIWRDSIPSRCSWFFRGLCYTAFKIRPSLRINSVNPEQTSLLNHPWCSEVPLSLCPTYFNVNLNLELLSVSDFRNDGAWDFTNLACCLGTGWGVLLRNWVPLILLVTIIGFGLLAQ
ncbi:uncharacterized protein LOC120255390 [Dioscorea cayenensis subsp. rotundata]|uniref:Uncharacterized protein LOC120255390 n=1 Tax=Dioscorea cayennensis subsp. rotundata TaxID=55577 RepID=A0AB40AWF7_DIOCR|nr:uncharacterized protein LOC120255390 [Dioscorea cayenensis subsp. rotundata]